MRLIFVDDSQQRNPPRSGLGHLVAVGGVVVRDQQLRPLAQALAEIREDLSIPDGEELKWKPPKGSLLAAAGREVVQQLRRRMLEAAREHEVRTIVVVLDHSAAYTSRTVAEAGQEILKWLFERVSMLLGDVKDIGIIVADKPGGGAAEEGRWLSETLRLTDLGTEFVRAGAVVLPVVTAPSHHVPHLQLADLVVAATTAAVAGLQSGLRLKDALRPLAYRHALGDANGAGLVLFPEKHNLHYWALGETGWSRPSALSGLTLPAKQYEYGESDGLPAAEEPGIAGSK